MLEVLCLSLVLQGAPQVAAGPMVGHVSEERARVWVQASGPGWLVLEVRPAGTEEWGRARWPSGRERRAAVDAGRDFTAVCEVDGLAPATDYEYRLCNADGPLPAASEQSFRTPPPPGEAEDFMVAFGSCAGDWGPDPSQPVWKAVDALHPQAFLWLGDNVYYDRDSAEWTDPAAMGARWRTQRALPNLQPMLRRTASYAVWDDHDFGPDDTDRLYPHREASLGIFTSYWANPSFGTGGEQGVWHRFTRGRVEFFLLDTRFHRDPDWVEAGPDKTLLGAAQWEWLERSLAESRADFKVIVSATQVLARYHDYESWNLYPADRDRLLRRIRERRIGGVFFLSGDRHFGEVLRWLPPSAPYPLWEFTSSPLAAGLHHTVPDDQAPERLPGSAAEAENFGVLEFRFPRGDPAPGAAAVRFTLRAVDGAVLRGPVELRLADLQPR